MAVLSDECSSQCSLQAFCSWNCSFPWKFFFKLSLPFLGVVVSEPAPQSVHGGNQGYGTFDFGSLGQHCNQSHLPLIWNQSFCLYLVVHLYQVLHCSEWKSFEKIEANAIQTWGLVGKLLDVVPHLFLGEWFHCGSMLFCLLNHGCYRRHLVLTSSNTPYSRRFATVTARTAWKGPIFPPNIAPEVPPPPQRGRAWIPCFEIGI